MGSQSPSITDSLCGVTDGLEVKLGGGTWGGALAVVGCGGASWKGFYNSENPVRDKSWRTFG